jgi:hypothetical protein
LQAGTLSPRCGQKHKGRLEASMKPILREDFRPVVPRMVGVLMALCLTCAPAHGQGSGQYLGRLGTSRCIADSVPNRYGQSGSPYSPTSVRNRYAVSAPIIVSGR